MMMYGGRGGRGGGHRERWLPALLTLVSISPFGRRRALSHSRGRNQRAPRRTMLHDNTIPQRCPFRSLFGNLDYPEACREPPTTPPSSTPAGRLRLLSWLALAQKRESVAEKCRGAKCHAACYVKPSSLFTVVPVPRTCIPILWLLCIRVSHRTEPEFSPQSLPGWFSLRPPPPFFSGAVCP